jgi:hypothetical protein
MKKYLKYIIAIILIIIFVGSIVPKKFQNDTFYIISLGKQILENGLDRTDHFSWHKGLEYRYPHWLFDVINSGLYSSFGFDGVYIFVCSAAVIFMLVLFWILIKDKNNWFLSFVTTLIVAYMIQVSFSGRAQIISYMLFLIEIQLIERFIKKKDIWSSIGIGIISCIIANVHATAWIMTLVLFLPYIGEYVCSLFSIYEINNRNEKRYNKKLSKLIASGENEDSPKIIYLKEQIEECQKFRNNYKERENAKIIVKKIDNEKWLFIPLIFAIIGALITPIGNIPFTYYLKTSAGNSMTYISEHFPIVIASNLEFFTFTAILVALIGFTNSKLKLSDAFLILGLYLMTLSSQRNCYMMIPICAVPITRMINDFIKSNSSKQFNENSKPNNKIFVIFCILVLGYSIYNYAIDLNVPYVSEKIYPVKAAEFIKQNLDVQNIRLFNEYETGSYLLMQEIPVFIDSRCDLYTPQFNSGVTIFDDYMNVLYGEITIFELFDEYKITHSVVSNTSLMYTYMKDDERCKILYEDDYFSVFEYVSENIEEE